MIVGALIGFLLFTLIFYSGVVYAHTQGGTLRPDGSTVLLAAVLSAAGALVGLIF